MIRYYSFVIVNIIASGHVIINRRTAPEIARDGLQPGGELPAGDKGLEPARPILLADGKKHIPRASIQPPECNEARHQTFAERNPVVPRLCRLRACALYGPT